MQTTILGFTEQDAQAVGAVRAGDAERYRELVERHERRVFALAWSRLGDATLAEEVTQEAFIRAYRGLPLLGDGSKFSGWINSIARNIAINFGIRHRRELNKRERWALEQFPARTETPVEEADTPCTPETLRQTLAELPAAHRECLVLFYLERKSGAEAAASLGISEAALRVRLHRARGALREKLEERLADSLGKLGPARTLVPAIMAAVLASTSAKAATVGGAATVLGALAKLAPVSWLAPFAGAVIGVLPSMAFSMRAANAEQRNFRDPDGFHAQASRAMHRRILWVVPIVAVVMVTGIIWLTTKIGEKRSDWVVAAITVGCLAWAWRMLGARSRFQRGMLIWYGILAGGMVLKATGLVPASFSSWCFISSCLWLMWILRWQPTRMDHSLFLRAMLGTLEMSSPATPATSPPPRLEKADLKRFGKFLADRHFTNSFRWRSEGLLLRQTFVKPSWPMSVTAQFKAALPFAPRDSSNVLLHWNGTVTAQLSEQDARTHRVLKPEEAEMRQKVEAQVTAAVTHAWQDFRRGDTAAVDRALGEKADSEIFHVPPMRAAGMRWRQASLGLVVVLFLGMMLVGKYPQLLKPFFGHRAKPIARSAATNSAAVSHRTARHLAHLTSLEALSATNESAAPAAKAK